MKKLLVFLCGLLLVLWLAGEPKASIIAQGDYVFDNIANQYWVRNMLEYENLTWDGQISAVAARTAGPQGVALSAWRIATPIDVANLLTITPNTVMNTFEGTFGGRWQYLEYNTYHSVIQGRVDIEYGSTHQVFSAGHTLYGFVDFGYEYLLIDRYWVAVWTDPYTAQLRQSRLYDNVAHTALGAWVVADVVVPIPSSLWLLVSGIAGFGLIRSKTGRKQ